MTQPISMQDMRHTNGRYRYCAKSLIRLRMSSKLRVVCRLLGSALRASDLPVSTTPAKLTSMPRTASFRRRSVRNSPRPCLAPPGALGPMLPQPLLGRRHLCSLRAVTGVRGGPRCHRAFRLHFEENRPGWAAAPEMATSSPSLAPSSSTVCSDCPAAGAMDDGSQTFPDQPNPDASGAGTPRCRLLSCRVIDITRP